MRFVDKTNQAILEAQTRASGNFFRNENKEFSDVI